MVLGVERVDVGAPTGEFGVEGQAEQAAIAGVVDVAAQVGEDFGAFVFEVFVDEDATRLLGDEDAAVGGKAEVGRLFEPC